MGKRKFLVEEIAEWTDYEIAFVELCAERRWIVDNQEGTGTPVLYPNRKKDKESYYVAAHGKDKNGDVIISLVITAKHGRTKESLLRKAEAAKLGGHCRVESDTDADYVFPIERLPRAVKTFNLRRKQRHKGPPAEAIKKGQEALKKYREEQRKKKKSGV